MKQHGTACWLDEASSEMMVAPSSIINMQQVTGLQAPQRPDEALAPSPSSFSGSMLQQPFGGAASAISQVDLEDDSSPVSGDPMLISAPVSPDNEDSIF